MFDYFFSTTWFSHLSSRSNNRLCTAAFSENGTFCSTQKYSSIPETLKPITMFPSVVRALSRGVVAVGRQSAMKPITAVSSRFMSEHKEETDEEFYSRYESFFNRSDIDGWETRKAMNDLAGQDAIAEPKVIIAALKACRRLNDYALAIRFLENVRIKSEIDKSIYPYILQEISPCLQELGIDTPEALGYDKPELALDDVDHIY